MAPAAAVPFSRVRGAPAASRSRSRYASSLTSIATRRIVPPVKVPGFSYCSVTLSPLSKPTHNPYPECEPARLRPHRALGGDLVVDVAHLIGDEHSRGIAHVRNTSTPPVKRVETVYTPTLSEKCKMGNLDEQ